MMTLRPRLKNFKKLIPSAVCGSIVIQIALLSCTERNPEGEPRRTPAMEMNYTVTKTNFVRREGFEKESPIVSREKVKFKLYTDNDFTIRVDILDHEVPSFIISEAIPGNDYPVASYYEITPGKYQVYDTKGKVMSENTMPELDFSSLMNQLKEATSKQAALPGLITGGMLYFSLENSETKNTAPTALRKNNYGEAYQVYLNSYVNEFDGLSYTQESIVLKSNNTIEALRLYDSQNKIISSTSFRYEGEGKDIQLKNTQDVAVERNKDGSTSLLISLADYKDFTIALNLK